MPTLQSEMAMRAANREYQETLAKSVGLVFAARVPEVQQPFILYSGHWIFNETKNKLLEAVKAGVLLPEQGADIQMTAFIMTGRTHRGGRRDILVEAKLKAEPMDITKARRRAKAMRLATNVPTIPALFTIRPTMELLQLAEGRYNPGEDRGLLDTIPEPQEEQEKAKVLVIAFDPGWEFKHLWLAMAQEDGQAE